MDILTDTQHRALAFIDECNRSGYQPDDEEVMAWLLSPGPRRPTAGFEHNVSRLVAATLSGLGGLLEGGSPGETPLEHLRRLSWARGQRLTLTPLGTALLRSAERSSQDAADIDVVVLDRDDPLSYPTLVQHLAKAGRALLVDPYLRLEDLHMVLTATDIERVLISKQYKGSTDVRQAMSVYLTAASREIHVRASADSDVHDRLVVGPDEVHMIGTSINAVAAGSSSSLLIPIPEPGGQAMRTKANEWWAAAEVVLAPPPPPALETGRGSK